MMEIVEHDHLEDLFKFGVGEDTLEIADTISITENVDAMSIPDAASLLDVFE